MEALIRYGWITRGTILLQELAIQHVVDRN